MSATRTLQEEIRYTLRTAVGEEPGLIDPRHVEAWIRSNHDDPGELSEHELELAIVNAYKDAVLATPAENERLARELGI